MTGIAIFVFVCERIQIVAVILVLAGVKQIRHQFRVDYSVRLYIQISELVRFPYPLEPMHCYTEIPAGVQVFPGVRLNIAEVHTSRSLAGAAISYDQRRIFWNNKGALRATVSFIEK